MTDSEIGELVSKLLRERFKGLGFQNSTVASEQDFDGDSILRVTAHFKGGNVPSDRLIEAVHDIRSKLLQRGEERFVFLNGESPQAEAIDEDVE